MSLGRQSIAVILNNHTTYGEWCGGPDRNGMWYHPGSAEYTEERWIEDWAMLAARYCKCPQVVGFDLRNEVRFCPWPFRWPTWQSGWFSWLALGRDWAGAAAACADRVLQENKQLLIVVERIIWPMGELQPYMRNPGPLLPHLADRLVLAVHHYSWNGPGRYLAFGHTMSEGISYFLRSFVRSLGIFSPENYGDMTKGQLMGEMFRQWGFILQSNTCPVWVSEFGSFENPEHYDTKWFERFVECLGSLEADFAYWPLNVGNKPASGHGEPYGLLGADWRPKPEGDRRIDLLRQHGLLPPPPSGR